MGLHDKWVNNYLFAVQGVGIVFVAFFLAAYLGGLPSTAVLHSEGAFRVPLMAIGVVFLLLILSAVIIAVALKKK